MKFLYHATSIHNKNGIENYGLVTGYKSNWEGMSMRDAIYLAVNPEIAIDYVESSDSYNGEGIVVFKVNPEMLDWRKFGYDWNNRCEYEEDINSVAYFDNIPATMLEISDDDNYQTIHDFCRMNFYEKIMCVFDEEVETNKAK